MTIRILRRSASLGAYLGGAVGLLYSLAAAVLFVIPGFSLAVLVSSIWPAMPRWLAMMLGVPGAGYGGRCSRVACVARCRSTRVAAACRTAARAPRSPNDLRRGPPALRTRRPRSSRPPWPSASVTRLKSSRRHSGVLRAPGGRRGAPRGGLGSEPAQPSRFHAARLRDGGHRGQWKPFSNATVEDSRGAPWTSFARTGASSDGRGASGTATLVS